MRLMKCLNSKVNIAECTTDEGQGYKTSVAAFPYFIYFLTMLDLDGNLSYYKSLHLKNWFQYNTVDIGLIYTIPKSRITELRCNIKQVSVQCYKNCLDLHYI